jgi:cell shape-determining protein MreD
MANFAALLLISIAVILQNTIVTRINLLVGAADLALLVLLSWVLHSQETNTWKWGVVTGLLIGFSSALPIWIPVVGYSFVVGLVRLLQSRIWQAPYWMLLASTFFGTLIVYGLEISALWVFGTLIDLEEAISIVVLPSVVLNILFILPVYFFVGEVSKMVFPKEVDV